MSPLSTISFKSLNATVKLPPYTYVNGDRQFAGGGALSGTAYNSGISLGVYYNIRNIQDVSINNDALTFLINRPLSASVLQWVKEPATLFTDFDYINTYYYCDENIEENNNLKIRSSTNVESSQLYTIPFKDSNLYNIVPLKAHMGIDGLVDYSTGIVPHRRYEGIYFGNNQEHGYNNVYLQYSTEKFPITFKSDKISKVYIPQYSTTSAISANRTLELNGAFGGSSPLNSDVIFFDRFGYGNYTDNGFPESNFNGTPLCLWLSADSTNCAASLQWVERWYDPNTVTQGGAFIAPPTGTQSIATLSTEGDFFQALIYDKPSNLNVIQPKTSFDYLRYGPNRNEVFVDSLSSNLLIDFTSWSQNIEDVVNNTRGFAVGNYSDEVFDEAVMDGSFHFHIPPTDILHTNHDITVGVFAYQDNWKCGIDTQFFGNFSNNEGYGLFFNTGATNELITFPTTSGFIYGFNYKGLRVFEKSINTSTGVTASRIDYITTDLFGSRWTYDGINKKIYKLDTDDLLKEVITLSLSANIAKMQINSQNELFILDTYNGAISGFDTTGNLIIDSISATIYNNFEIDQDDVSQPTMADIVVTDNENDQVKSLGTNIYKNNALFYHMKYKPQAMNVDSGNNYWIAYNGNRILKLSPDGKVIFDKSLNIAFSDETSIELNFVKEIKNGCDYDVVWVVFNTHNYIVKLDSNGNIMRRLDVTDVVNLKRCNAFTLNVKGDFTGFENKRKFDHIDGNIISSIFPAITLKANLNCGGNKKIVQLHYPARQLENYTHVAFTHQINDNSTTTLRLYINGIKKNELILDGILFIDMGTLVSPFVIGGHSGKLGAKNVERSLNDEDFFEGKIDDVRLYGVPLNSFQLKAISDLKHPEHFQDMVWYMPTPRRTYMEEIINYNLNKYKGGKSHLFNLKIKNLGITDEDTQESIRESIMNVIDKLIPVNTELNQIIFD